MCVCVCVCVCAWVCMCAWWVRMLLVASVVSVRLSVCPLIHFNFPYLKTEKQN